MPTTREAVLAALFDVIDAIGMIPSTSAPVKTRRNDPVPQKISEGGLVILFDGDPGEPEYTMSPLRYHWQHRAEILVAVQMGSGRDLAFDLLCGALGLALADDPTLGGICDWVEPGGPAPDDLAVEGAATIKAARIPVILHYTTSDPLALPPTP